MELIKRFWKPSNSSSFFLLGPRGTGKSTLMEELYSKAIVLDLLKPNIYREFLARPENLLNFVKSHKNNKTFVIDEVQKIPELLSVVHQLIEMKQGWQFALTGSSARKLKRTGIDLLGGRAHLKHLHPFMAAEISTQFDIKKHLNFGMLPLVLFSENPNETLKAYIALYMQEEVQMEGLVRKIDYFSRFLEVISFSQASVINYANIARECKINNKTVENYHQILDDLLLSFSIPVFTKRAQRILSTHPKFYYFDVGVYRSIRPMGPLDNPDAILGHAIETLIAQHLRAWLDYSNKEGKLYFWRTKSGLEVDFIIYGEIGFYAIEVKKSVNVSLQDLRSLTEFKKDYPECKLFLIYGGEHRLLINDILCLPMTDFLLSLKPDYDMVDTTVV